MRRKRMHGKRRRRSSCKPSPLKHTTLNGRTLYEHAHDEDGNHPRDKGKERAKKFQEARNQGEEEAKKNDKNWADQPVGEADPDYARRQMELDKGPSIKQAPDASDKDSEYSTIDKVQDALSVAGMSPGYGIAADGVNFVISGVRGIGSLLSGDLESAKKHGTQALFSAGGAIPIVGQGITSVNLGRRTKAIGDAMSKSMVGHTRTQKAIDAYDAGEGAVNIVKGGE